jgi:hypothetical protein
VSFSLTAIVPVRIQHADFVEKSRIAFLEPARDAIAPGGILHPSAAMGNALAKIGVEIYRMNFLDQQ